MENGTKGFIDDNGLTIFHNIWITESIVTTLLINYVRPTVVTETRPFLHYNLDAF